MKQKPFACFGYVLIANYYDEGEVFEVRLTANSKTALFFVKGHVVCYDKDTNEFIEEYFPGAYADVHREGVFKDVAVEASVCFCFDPKRHNDYVPPMGIVNLAQGEENICAAGTRLFLCEGTLSIDGQEFTGPCQILMQGVKQATALTDAYGLIIK